MDDFNRDLNTMLRCLIDLVERTDGAKYASLYVEFKDDGLIAQAVTNTNNKTSSTHTITVRTVDDDGDE